MSRVMGLVSVGDSLVPRSVWSVWSGSDDDDEVLSMSMLSSCS